MPYPTLWINPHLLAEMVSSELREVSRDTMCDSSCTTLAETPDGELQVQLRVTRDEDDKTDHVYGAAQGICTWNAHQAESDLKDRFEQWLEKTGRSGDRLVNDQRYESMETETAWQAVRAMYLEGLV